MSLAQLGCQWDPFASLLMALGLCSRFNDDCNPGPGGQALRELVQQAASGLLGVRLQERRAIEDSPPADPNRTCGWLKTGDPQRVGIWVFPLRVPSNKDKRLHGSYGPALWSLRPWECYGSQCSWYTMDVQSGLRGQA